MATPVPTTPVSTIAGITTPIIQEIDDELVPVGQPLVPSQSDALMGIPPIFAPPYGVPSTGMTLTEEMNQANAVTFNQINVNGFGEDPAVVRRTAEELHSARMRETRAQYAEELSQAGNHMEARFLEAREENVLRLRAAQHAEVQAREEVRTFSAEMRNAEVNFTSLKNELREAIEEAKAFSAKGHELFEQKVSIEQTYHKMRNEASEAFVQHRNNANAEIKRLRSKVAEIEEESEDKKKLDRQLIEDLKRQNAKLTAELETRSRKQTSNKSTPMQTPRNSEPGAEPERREAAPANNSARQWYDAVSQTGNSGIKKDDFKEFFAPDPWETADPWMPEAGRTGPKSQGNLPSAAAPPREAGEDEGNRRSDVGGTRSTPGRERRRRSPSNRGRGNDGQGEPDWRELLISALRGDRGNRDRDDKPRVKEAEIIKLPSMPKPEEYRSWRTQVKEEIRAASDKPDDAWKWVNAVYTNVITDKSQLMADLRDPGTFVTLDTKVLAALTRIAKGDLEKQILTFKEAEATRGRVVRGRQVLLMYEMFFRTNEEAGSLYDLEDMLKVSLHGDDLKSFMYNWDAVVAGMKHIPDEHTMRDLFFRQIKKSNRMRYDIDTYERAKEGDPKHTYAFLEKSVRDLITRERVKDNRDRIAKSTTSRYGMPAPGSYGRRTPSRSQSPKGSFRSSRSPSRDKYGKSKGVCYDFLSGKCKKGSSCKYRHEKPKRSGSGSNSRSPGGDRRKQSRSPGSDRAKHPKKDLKNKPCRYFKEGKCKKGEKCPFKHASEDSNAVPAGRADSPAPNKKKDKGRDKEPSKAAPCIAKAMPVLTIESIDGVESQAAMPSVNHYRGGNTKRASGKKPRDKRVRFNDKVEYLKHESSGKGLKVGPRIRGEGLTSFRTDSCPKSDPEDAKIAIENAKSLHRVLSDETNQPKCGKNCDLRHEESDDLCCPDCRIPANNEDEVSYIGLMSKHVGHEDMWLGDTGTDQDIIGKNSCHIQENPKLQNADRTLRIHTANGEIRTNQTTEVKLKCLKEPMNPYVLDDSPCAMSIGMKCLEQGYDFVWPKGSKPFFIRPDGKTVFFKIASRVPFVDSECKAEVHDGTQNLVEALEAFQSPSHAIAASKVAAKEPEVELDPGDGESDDEGEGPKKTEENLRAEAMSPSHLLTHRPKNPYCETCKRAKMLKPQARRKGGSRFVEAEAFGDHIVADHVQIVERLEQGINGECYGLVVKDIHSQFRYAYTTKSKDARESEKSLVHFLRHTDEVGVIYTDNSPELEKALGNLNYRHQTSIEYLDSTKSIVEREIRTLLEGARAALHHACIPTIMWPYALQHQSVMLNAQKQLNGNDPPWKLRFGEDFPYKKIPFGSLVLFWRNPKRFDDPGGKMRESSIEGVFLGYHVQPGFTLREEYIVAPLDGFSSNLVDGYVRTQRARKIELPEGNFVFPIRDEKFSRVRHEDVAPEAPILDVPEEQALEGNAQDGIDDQTDIEEVFERLAAKEAEERESGASSSSTKKKVPLGEIMRGASFEMPPEVTEHDKKYPDESIIPDGTKVKEGYVYDGIQVIRKYRNSSRIPGCPSAMWAEMYPQMRKEEWKKYIESLKKKNAALEAMGIKPDHEVTKEMEAKATPSTSSSSPAMPVIPSSDEPEPEPHRQKSIRDMINEKIAELQTYQNYELFAAVAQAVTRQQIDKTPAAQKSLDTEWNKLKDMPAWDQNKVRECRQVVNEAIKANKKVHIGRIFEICVLKGSELPEGDPRRKYKGRTVFQGNNVFDENSDYALFAEMSSSPASMEGAKILDAFGSQPGYSKSQADAKSAYTQALFEGVPTWIRLPRNRWPKEWQKRYQDPIVPLLLALYGHPDSGGLWEKHFEKKIAKNGWKPVLKEIWQSIFYHPKLDLLLTVYVDDLKMAGPTENIKKGWESIQSVVVIDDPEPFGRYFGCEHREEGPIMLKETDHPFSHIFSKKNASVARHKSEKRKEDYWEHDPVNKRWIKHHLYPRTKLFTPPVPKYSDVTFTPVRQTEITWSSGGTDVIVDDWKEVGACNQKEWWTGKTTFNYTKESGDVSESSDGDSEGTSAPAPGGKPHRKKSAAKREAKQQRFKTMDSIGVPLGQCMKKKVNVVYYDMIPFLDSCVDAYCKLAKFDRHKLKPASTPFHELRTAKPVPDGSTNQGGKLQPIASKILMKVLFAARMARYDLLRATQSLASRVTKWSHDCDAGLHRLICYIESSKQKVMRGFIGDKFEDCKLWLFADADFAGEFDSKSTTGSAIFLVGPNTYFPLNAFSKKQTSTAMSSTEAEVVAAKHAVRAQGLPTLSLFGFLLGRKSQSQTGSAKDKFKKVEEDNVTVTCLDPEIDEIRYGEHHQREHSCSNILHVRLHSDFEVQFMEDNQAVISILALGSSASMRHTDRTQRVSFNWLSEQFNQGHFNLINVDTTEQVADILTKPFTSISKWDHAISFFNLVNYHPKKPTVSAPSRGGDTLHTNFEDYDRMLVEYCCSEDSKLGQLRRSSKGCYVLRVTEADDARTEECRDMIVKRVKDFRKRVPDGKILFYVSLPCTGGCPWNHINKDNPGGKQKIKLHQKKFWSLFKRMRETISSLEKEEVRVAMELPSRCSYWKSKDVETFCNKHDLTHHKFDGCAMGLTNRDGLPMLKTWNIATNIDEFEVLENYKCDGEHEHAQSRGDDLKRAES